MLIEAALSDGHWLLVASTLDLPPTIDPVATEFSRASFATWLVLSVLLAVLLSMLAARRLIKPLSELAIAVEQLGGSGDAPHLLPRGPREVQGTMRAFNRMQERLRRFNDDRTRMIAAMSHDLRTPLTRLRLRAELVEDHDQQQKMLADLDMMGGMIESVLSFARDDTEHESRSLVDLSALVEGICQDADDAGEPVTFSGPRGVTISCRPTAMRRAISNLVDNAVKYGRKRRRKPDRPKPTASSSPSKTRDPVFRGASVRRSLNRSTGLKALATLKPAVSDLVSPSLARSYGSMAETSSLATARVEA